MANKRTKTRYGGPVQATVASAYQDPVDEYMATSIELVQGAELGRLFSKHPTVLTDRFFRTLVYYVRATAVDGTVV